MHKLTEAILSGSVYSKIQSPQVQTLTFQHQPIQQPINLHKYTAFDGTLYQSQYIPLTSQPKTIMPQPFVPHKPAFTPTTSIFISQQEHHQNNQSNQADCSKINSITVVKRKSIFPQKQQQKFLKKEITKQDSVISKEINKQDSVMSKNKSIYSVVSNMKGNLFQKVKNPLAQQQFQDERDQIMTRMSKMDSWKHNIQKNAKNRLAPLQMAIDEQQEDGKSMIHFQCQ